MTTLFAKITRPYALACLTTAALALSGAVLAGTPSDSNAAARSDAAPSVTVRYDDLNLSTDKGTVALYQRIASAARQVCPDQYTRILSVVTASRACQANAIARAVADVNNPKLALVHAARVGHG